MKQALCRRCRWMRRLRIAGYVLLVGGSVAVAAYVFWYVISRQPQPGP